MNSERTLLLVPMLVLATTAYVACSDDVSSVYELPMRDAGYDTDAADSPPGDVSAWPDAAEDDATDDSPISGGG